MRKNNKVLFLILGISIVYGGENNLKFYAEKKQRELCLDDFIIEIDDEKVGLESFYSKNYFKGLEKESSNHIELIYSSEDITFFSYLVDNKIICIQLDTNKYKTYRGLMVGDSYEKMIEKYGSYKSMDYFETKKYYTYFYKGYLLEFIMNDNKIIRIVYEVI